MILVDLTPTSHTRAKTGVQRVSRSLHVALARRAGHEVRGITWDPYRRAWRRLVPFESENLLADDTHHHRAARWPTGSRLRGTLERWTGIPAQTPLSGSSLVAPEIFSRETADRFPGLCSRISGPRVALFHDAIALKLPELTPTRTVARFPAYLRELLMFDGIAAVSQDSRNALVDWWRWMGITDAPEVSTIPLGIDEPGDDPVLARTTSAPVVLCVGTLEGRKNHIALLDACESLWKQGHCFELRLIGMAHPDTGKLALQRVQSLQGSGRPLRYDGAVDEKALCAAYHECAFTVYPSLMEGFGLPVLESLSYGKPCICSSQGALGESSRDGGCLSLASVDSSSLASAICTLLTNPEHHHHLSVAARGRTLRSWDTYATDLLTWMQTLRRRAAQDRSPLQG